MSSRRPCQPNPKEETSAYSIDQPIDYKIKQQNNSYIIESSKTVTNWLDNIVRLLESPNFKFGSYCNLEVRFQKDYNLVAATSLHLLCAHIVQTTAVAATDQVCRV